MLATIHHGYPGIIWTAKREFCNFNIGLHHQTTDLDSSILLNSIQLEKNTHIDFFLFIYFFGGGLGENLAVIAELGRLSGCFGHSGAESNYYAKGCPLLVSGALQHLAGHDPGSISTEKAAYPRKDKNWAGTFFKKTAKREMDRIRAKRRELPLQWWSLYGSVDDFG